MRSMIKEKGGVSADVFIEFLKCLITGAKRAIFLIVDRDLAHIAKRTKAFVDSLNGRLRLFYAQPTKRISTPRSVHRSANCKTPRRRSLPSTKKPSLKKYAA
jgi:hypothetical protein